MTKSKKYKGESKNARIKELRKELVNNDDLYKKNKEQYRVQVQVALCQRGLPQGSPMYDSILEQKALELQEEKIKNDYGFIPINPIYKFQADLKLIKIQKQFSDKRIIALESNIKEIETQLSEVEIEIVAQNGRIEERRIQIIEDLKSLGNDTSDIEKPNYIG